MLVNVSPRINKPRIHEVMVNWAHPLTRKLEFAALFEGGVAVDLAGESSSVPNGSPQTALANLPGIGVGAKLSSSWFSFPGTASDAPYVGADTTILVRGTITSNSVFHMLAVKESSTSVGFFEYRINSGPPANLSLVCPTGGSPSDTTALAINTVYDLGVTATFSNSAAGTVIFYINGIKSTTSTGNNYNGTTTSNTPILVGKRSDTVGEWSGTVFHVYIWNRVLSDAEMAWLSSEPYAFFIPRAPFRAIVTPTIPPSLPLMGQIWLA
jgi:hypothetical protein